jgi:hypothetical protein
MHFVTSVSAPRGCSTCNSGVRIQRLDYSLWPSNTGAEKDNKLAQTEGIATREMHAPVCMGMHFCDFRHSEERRDNGQFCLGGNGQGVEMNAQNLVKATTTEICCHQTGHSVGNGE